MGTIVVTTNTTLDGVVEDPDGKEGMPFGGWFDQFSGTDRAAWATVATDEALRAGALLLGRRSDAWFGARWQSRAGVWADRLNSIPKYVVSSTIDQPAWSNSTVLSGDVVDEVAKLKQDVDGEILVYASFQLIRTLLEHHLVDEVRLVVFPVVVGAGERLFGQNGVTTPLRLVAVRAIGAGLAFLTYQPVQQA